MCITATINHIFIALTAVTLTTNKATNNQAGYIWPHIVRMRARGGEENEAFGSLKSEGEIDSVNQSFIYLVMQVF